MGKDTTLMGDPRDFKTTHWSLVRGARDTRAMGSLIRLYWKPLYYYVRRRGYSREMAKDVVQGFLTGLLERGAILKADRARGRFRTFLRASINNFIRDQNKKASRKKRSPSRLVLSLDFRSGESDYPFQVREGEPPERVLDRAWAQSIWEDSIAHLKGENEHLRAFNLYLNKSTYARISRKTGLTKPAAKMAVHRLKVQLRELIISRIKETVSSEKDLKAEIAEFRSLLS